MKISRDTKFEDDLVDGLRRLLSRGDAERSESEILHVSSLIYCQRKPILSALLPGNGNELDRSTVLKFVAGRAQHDAVQAVDAYARGKETQVIMNGIIGTMDVLNPRGIIEFKGTRASMRKHDMFGIDSEAPYYVDQCRSYASLCWMNYPDGIMMRLNDSEHQDAVATWGSGVTKNNDGQTIVPRDVFRHAHLAVIHLNGAYDAKGYDGMNPDLRAWRLEFSAKELEDWYALLQGRKQRILDTRAFLAGSKGKLKELQDAVTSELLPQGPAYGFECGTAEAGCAFHRVCYP